MMPFLDEEHRLACLMAQEIEMECLFDRVDADPYAMDSDSSEEDVALAP
jgi:hypothetical protein